MKGKVLAGLALGAVLVSGAQAQFGETVLVPGQVHEGSISEANAPMEDGVYSDCFIIEGEERGNYEISISSREFEPFLIGGEGTCDNANPRLFNSSRLRFTGQRGPFAVFVQNNVPGQFGRFRLQVSGPGEQEYAARNTPPAAAQAATAQAATAPARAASPAAANALTTANYNAAWDAYEARRYPEAVRLIRPFAEAGDAYAQAMLGNLYYNGNGVNRDVLESARWYTRAAEQGHERAQQTLVQIAESVSQAMFIDHIDRYGPDTTNLTTFSNDVFDYCALRGKNCSQLLAARRKWENAHNRAAEAANMRRIWNNYGSGPSNEQQMAALRSRTECLRRVRQSIERQTRGQQTWRYMDTC